MDENSLWGERMTEGDMILGILRRLKEKDIWRQLEVADVIVGQYNTYLLQKKSHLTDAINQFYYKNFKNGNRAKE